MFFCMLSSIFNLFSRKEYFWSSFICCLYVCTISYIFIIHFSISCLELEVQSDQLVKYLLPCCIEYCVEANKWRNDIIDMGKKVLICFYQIDFLYRAYINYLRLLYKLPQTGWAYNRRNSFSHNPRGWKSKIKVFISGSMLSQRTLWENYFSPLPASGGCRHSLAYVCINLICLHIHLAFPHCLYSLSSY